MGRHTIPRSGQGSVSDVGGRHSGDREAGGPVCRPQATNNDDAAAVQSATIDSMGAESTTLGTDLESVGERITSLITAMKQVLPVENAL